MKLPSTPLDSPPDVMRCTTFSKWSSRTLVGFLSEVECQQYCAGKADCTMVSTMFGTHCYESNPSSLDLENSSSSKACMKLPSTPLDTPPDVMRCQDNYNWSPLGTLVGFLSEVE